MLKNNEIQKENSNNTHHETEKKQEMIRNKWLSVKYKWERDPAWQERQKNWKRKWERDSENE